MRINNNAYQRHANISLIAQVLWQKQSISRIDIARMLNLHRSTVTNIIGFLIEQHLVYEGAEESTTSKSGRKPIMLSLDEQFGCVLGIEVQPTHYHAVIVTITGRSIYEEQGKVEKSDFNEVLTNIISHMLPKITSLHIPLLGIGIGVPGIVDASEGIITYSHPFSLHNYDVFGPLHKTYALPVMIDNDANSCAYYQLAEHPSQKLQDFMCLFGNYHTSPIESFGVGIGLCIDGKVYHGSSWAAGEFLPFSWEQDTVHVATDAHLVETTPHRALIKEFFTSLIPVISVLNPSSLYIFGKPFGETAQLQEMLSVEVPLFNATLRKMNCSCIINTSNTSVVARGAACMYLQRLFSVPELAQMDKRTAISWDEVIHLAQKRQYT